MKFKTLIILFLCLLSSSTYAEDIWIDTGWWSRHTDGKAHHYRENNTGYGLEITLSKNSSIHLGNYRNSFDKDATYLGYGYQPIHLSIIKAGIVLTTITGYTENGRVLLVPIPMITAEYSKIGMNLVYYPKVVTSVQLKIKF